MIFLSVYNPSDSCLQNQSTYNNYKCSLISEVFLSAVDIENSLNDLDITKGAGLDGVPKKILKYCLCLLYLPIFHIFNKSLNSGIFLEVWKLVICVSNI